MMVSFNVLSLNGTFKRQTKVGKFLLANSRVNVTHSTVSKPCWQIVDDK